MNFIPLWVEGKEVVAESFFYDWPIVIAVSPKGEYRVIATESWQTRAAELVDCPDIAFLRESSYRRCRASAGDAEPSTMLVFQGPCT